MEKFSKTIDRCQISGKKDLKTIISLGFLPPVNKLRKINSLSHESIFFPTDLKYSKSSKLVQLTNIVDKTILFPKEYPYTSSTTKILRENFKELYNECSRLFDLSQNDLIIDIGSNDGNLLSNFKNNHKVLGITPEDIGKIAIKKGIKSFTHLYNAMSGFQHRKPGVVAAAFSKAKYAEIICDLIHVSKEMIKLAFKNIDKLYSITDSISASGMPDGKYKVGTYEVYKKNGVVKLDEDTLGGSIVTMDKAFKNIVEIGFSTL